MRQLPQFLSFFQRHPFHEVLPLVLVFSASFGSVNWEHVEHVWILEQGRSLPSESGKTPASTCGSASTYYVKYIGFEIKQVKVSSKASLNPSPEILCFTLSCSVQQFITLHTHTHTHARTHTHTHAHTRTPKLSLSPNPHYPIKAECTFTLRHSPHIKLGQVKPYIWIFEKCY